MPYYRRPYKRARYGKRIKYSVQQKALDFILSGTATAKVESFLLLKWKGCAR